MDVSIIGLGKLGLPLAVAMADRGLHVVGVDKNPKVVEAINRGYPLTYEPGLGKLLYSVRGTFTVTTDLEAVTESGFVIILVATPSNPDGSLNPEQVLEVCRDLAPLLTGRYRLVVVASTVMPGTCQGAIRDVLESGGLKVGKHVGLCYVPEFVALGSVIAGFRNPDFVLVGEFDEWSGKWAEQLYKRFCANNPPIYRTSLVNAEIIKMAVNFYLTTKISFANTLAEICEAIPGANVDAVTKGVGLDKRIGSAYLKGATAFGGNCLLRDVGAMKYLFESVGLKPRLADAVHEINTWQKERLLWMVLRAALKCPKRKVGVLGLAFKPDTNVTTGSVGMYLVDALGGNKTLAYDPLVAIGQSLRSAQECVDRSGVVVITTPHPEFANIHVRRKQVIIDCWRVLGKSEVEAAGAEYVGIGMGQGVRYV